MVVDGMEGPEFEYVEADPTFSPNSQHLAYSARTSGKKCVVVLDGKPSPEFEQTSGTCSFYPWSGDLSFSPDGEHLAYKAQRARDKWVMVVDGKEGQEFQQLGSPLFSPHGQHLAYAALTVDKKWVVLLDGKTGPEFEREDPIGLPVDELRFSPDGKHFAYRAKTAPNKWAIVLDGQPGPEFEKVVKGPLFSPDSSRLIYEVLHGPKNFIVVDGKPGPEFDAVPFPYGKGKGFSPWGSSIAEFAFSPNGQHSSYIARRGQKLVVTQDAETGPEFSFIMAGPRFSSDSQHVAYMAGEPGDISVVLDGKTIKSIPVPEGKPLYTPSGSQSAVDRDTAWDRAEGGLVPLVPLWPVLFGGNLVTTLAAKNVNFVEHLIFSPDGQHLVYVVGRGGHVFDGKEHGRAQRRAVLDGREGRQYDADALFNLTFSPDCSHFAFEVHNADKGKSFVVLDGQDGKPYDELLTNKFGWWQPWVQGTLRFAHDNSVTYLAREGRKFYRVTQPLP